MYIISSCTVYWPKPQLDGQAQPAVINNNITFGLQKPECSKCHRHCETGELIKNGGFEELSVDPRQTFTYWQEGVGLINIVSSPVAYEGIRSASFSTQNITTELQIGVISQNVTVTPGCQYKLSFAENFLSRGGGTPPQGVLH